jgi:hypothetical protein
LFATSDQLTSDGYERIFTCYSKGTNRITNIIRQDILKLEKCNAKGRTKKDLIPLLLGKKAAQSKKKRKQGTGIAAYYGRLIIIKYICFTSCSGQARRICGSSSLQVCSRTVSASVTAFHISTVPVPEKFQKSEKGDSRLPARSCKAKSNNIYIFLKLMLRALSKHFPHVAKDRMVLVRLASSSNSGQAFLASSSR